MRRSVKTDTPNETATPLLLCGSILYQISSLNYAYGIVGRGLQQVNHHFANMLRSTELTVLACRCQLAQHILIQVTLHIQLCNVVFVEVIQTG